MELAESKYLLGFIGEIKNRLLIEVKAKNSSLSGDILSKMHEEDIIRAHRLVSLMLKELEGHVSNFQLEKFEEMFGQKETAVNVLNKLSTMLLKFIPVEQEMMVGSAEEDTQEISKQDAELLEQYIARYIQAQSD